MATTRKSSILGPDGLPFETALLSEEMAQPTRWGARSVMLESVASGLAPERLAMIMREANHGHARSYLTLAMEMEERYMHYRSQLQVRRLAFEAIDVSVDAPEGYDPKILAAVHDLVESPLFGDMATSLQDAVSKGYSVVEPLWDYREGYLRPIVYKWRDPRFFQFDPTTLEELRLADLGNLEGIPIPEGKFIRHLPNIATGVPLRRGLARPAAWAFMVQSFTLQDWSAFAEIYGVPLRVGKYGPQATEADKRTLLWALRAIANDGAAAIPASMTLDTIQVSGQHGEAVFGALIDYMDRNVSKVVLGQTMTSDVSKQGGALATAKIHNEVRLDIVRADGRQTAATINRDLIPWFVAFNFGPQDVYPKVRFPVADPEDIKALADAVKSLVPLGFRVGQREIRTKLGLSEPEDDEEILAQPASSPNPPPAPHPNPTPGRSTLSLRHGGGCRCPACGGTATLGAKDPTLPGDADAIDELLADQLDEWEEVADPLLEQIFALAAEETSYDAVLRRLDGLRLDTGPLQERLARASAIARGIGATEQ